MNFTFTEQQIQEAINHPHPNYINNLRYRNEKLQRDCFIRGTLAEIFFRDFLKHYGFNIQSNIADNFVDIDLQLNGIVLLNQIIPFDSPIRLEIKTSLRPNPNFDIFKSADLKIYKKSNSIEQDINWHIGIQVYFNQFKQDWESVIEQADDRLIYERYKDLEFSYSWITQDDTIKYLNSDFIKDQTWSYANKTFWKCPLHIHNRNIYEMIIYLLHLLIYQQQTHIDNLNAYITQIKGNNV